MKQPWQRYMWIGSVTSFVALALSLLLGAPVAAVVSGIAFLVFVHLEDVDLTL